MFSAAGARQSRVCPWYSDNSVPADNNGRIRFRPRRYRGALCNRFAEGRFEEDRGIGTKVISNLRDIAKIHSLSNLRGKVFKNNLDSLRWLQRCGFEIASELPEENSYLVLAEV